MEACHVTSTKDAIKSFKAPLVGSFYSLIYDCTICMVNIHDICNVQVVIEQLRHTSILVCSEHQSSSHVNNIGGTLRMLIDIPQLLFAQIFFLKFQWIPTVQIPKFRCMSFNFQIKQPVSSKLLPIQAHSTTCRLPLSTHVLDSNFGANGTQQKQTIQQAVRGGCYVVASYLVPSSIGC